MIGLSVPSSILKAQRADNPLPDGRKENQDGKIRSDSSKQKDCRGGVTSGFQKISDGVVSGYTGVEDRFVDRYLTRDGESTAMAKERLRKEEARRRKEAQTMARVRAHKPGREPGV